MEIIGLSGYARTGKDEAAKVLVEKHGFTRVGFADKLRQSVYNLDCDVSGYKNGMRVWRNVQSVIDEYGWDGYKETSFKDSVRRVLQRMGTEVGRQTLSDSIWVDSALTGFPDDARLVVTDCRFENEAAAIKERGGSVWRIYREGVGPINDHISETGLDHWDFDKHLINNGSLTRWHEYVSSVYMNRNKNASRI